MAWQYATPAVVISLTLLLGAPTGYGGEPDRPQTTLKLITDRATYDPDDTIMLVAAFVHGPADPLQLSDECGGGLYFHFVYERTDRPSPISTAAIWLVQFEKWTRNRELALRLRRSTDGTEITRQLCIHLPKLELPPGTYKMRVGYALDTRKLEPLIKTATGAKSVELEQMATERLKGAWDGALLSESVTITIGAGKGKK